MSMEAGAFGISADTMVVTSTYVTRYHMPILYISHEYDEEEGTIWQFHCGNDDYDMERMQLVRLDTILLLDPEIVSVADLPLGFCARRSSPSDPWEYNPEDQTS